MANISVEGKGPIGPQVSESLLPTAVAGYTRGLAVVYGADEFHCTLAALAGVAVIGLIEEDAVSLKNPVRVIEFGQAVGQIGAAVAANQLLAVNAAGQLVPAQPGQAVVARALEASGAAGDYITVFVLGGDAATKGDQVTHAVAAGAIAVASGTVGLGSGGALAMTLAAPTVAQDGTRIYVVAETAHAHTVTTPANKINGADDTVTFAAVGDGVELEAVGGIWMTRSLKGAVLSEV